MKLFSRKALVAGAAAVVLSFAGTSVAAANEVSTTETSQAPGGSSVSGSSKGVDPTNPDDENKGSSDAKEISAWISVFTAVIGALGALFSFATKYLGFKL